MVGAEHLAEPAAGHEIADRTPSRRDLLAALSPEMALRIEKAFGVSMDSLLRMQAWHDSYTRRQKAGEIDVKRFEPA